MGIGNLFERDAEVPGLFQRRITALLSFPFDANGNKQMGWFAAFHQKLRSLEIVGFQPRSIIERYGFATTQVAPPCCYQLEQT